jgi:hypothetical protein
MFVAVWAEALNVAPAVRILAVNWVGRVLLGLGRRPAGSSGLVANERRRARRRSTRTAFGRWRPFQIGIVNAKPNLSHWLRSTRDEKRGLGDLQTTVVAPGTPPTV